MVGKLNLFVFEGIIPKSLKKSIVPAILCYDLKCREHRIRVNVFLVWLKSFYNYKLKSNFVFFSQRNHFTILWTKQEINHIVFLTPTKTRFCIFLKTNLLRQWFFPKRFKGKSDITGQQNKISVTNSSYEDRVSGVMNLWWSVQLTKLTLIISRYLAASSAGKLNPAISNFIENHNKFLW